MWICVWARKRESRNKEGENGREKSLFLSAVGNESKERERGWSGKWMGRIREWNGKNQGMEREESGNGMSVGRKSGWKDSWEQGGKREGFSSSASLTISLPTLSPSSSWNLAACFSWLPPQFLFKSWSLGWKELTPSAVGWELCMSFNQQHFDTVRRKSCACLLAVSHSLNRIHTLSLQAAGWCECCCSFQSSFPFPLVCSSLSSSHIFILIFSSPPSIPVCCSITCSNPPSSENSWKKRENRTSWKHDLLFGIHSTCCAVSFSSWKQILFDSLDFTFNSLQILILIFMQINHHLVMKEYYFIPSWTNRTKNVHNNPYHISQKGSKKQSVQTEAVTVFESNQSVQSVWNPIC